MKGSIPRQFIDDLLTKSNIVDVINARVKLKKAGRDYQACCPFHHEKTPSFTVSEKKTILLLLWLWRERQCDFIFNGLRQIRIC